MAGWIKISREIANHWLWQDAERLKWWLDLLFLAAYEDRRQLAGKQLILLRKGQLIASLSFLCKRWGRSRTMIEPWLNLLMYDGMIEKSVSHNISIITICNYEKYQDSAMEDAHLDTPRKADEQRDYDLSDAQDNTHLNADLDAHPDAHLDAINKEIKEINNISTISISESDSKNFEFIQQLKNSPIWIEQMAMRFHIRVEDVNKRLEDFALDLQCRGTEHRDLNDARRHFNDWLRIQLEAERKKQSNVSDRKKSESERRGSEVVATSAEDYEGAF